LSPITIKLIACTTFTKLHGAHQKNKIHLKLIATLGNVVRERTRKVKPEPKNFVAFRNTDLDIYVLVNRFVTETICLALDKHGNLVVPSESTAAGFLILFPLAGALNHDSYTYRRVDTVANWDDIDRKEIILADLFRSTTL